MVALDPVTGAHPRALLEARLRQELARPAGLCAVFLFDIDFFKTVNDVYGHLRGDRVLRQLADCIRATVRRQDILFRYGGDEFVLILPETGQTEAIQQALHLTDRVRNTELSGEPPLHLTVSLGVATFPEDGTTPVTLLACADRRNYIAKRRGRGGVVADDVDTVDPGGSRLWERDAALRTTHDYLVRLRVAGRGSLRVHGQPGAGHTRFLTEVGRLARMRGFTVVPLPAEPARLPPPPPADGAGVLLVADTDAVDQVAALLDQWRHPAPSPTVVGLVYATVGADPPSPPLTELDNVELTPWSPSALRIWLRTVLRGEPSQTLTNWIVRQTGGLPAVALRELERLRKRNGLISAGHEGWTIDPVLLGGARRRMRLPTPLTALVGRQREVERAAQMLSTGRLVSLVGAGGIGKTRMSLSVAAAVADDFEDGVVFVRLAETRTGDEVIEAIAQVLDVAQSPGRSLLDDVTEQLAEVSMLLVLDNFEQVLEAGPMIGSVLSAAPAVSVLVTSREPLVIYGEQVYRVPPLQLPDLAVLPGGEAGVALAIARSPAVALFDQRARAANVDFVLTAETLPAVAELCLRLDGLPLAIELAAARADRLSPLAMLSYLGPRLDLPGEGLRDRPPRQQTLRGTVHWSYALLDETGRRVFTAVALFTGGAVAEAVLAVVEGAGSGAALPDGYQARRVRELTEALDTLVSKSLLNWEPEPDGRRRYLMLNTIHAYADELLAAPESAILRQRYLDHFTALAELAGVGMTSPGQAQWAETLRREYPNLRATLAWVLAAGDLAAVVRICLGLWRHWRNGNHIRDGRDWLDQVLALPTGLSSTERASLLYPAAVLAATQDDTATALRLGDECLTLTEGAGDREGAAQAHNILGVAAMLSGRYDEAADHFRYNLQLWRELDRKPGLAIALGNLAKVALRRGDVSAASEHINECLALERAAENSRGVLLGLTCLAEIRLAQHDLGAAWSVAREVLGLADELGDLFGEAVALHQLGQTALAAGQRSVALRLFLDALERRNELGDRADLSTSLEAVAEVVVDDQAELAVRLFAAVGSLRRRYGLADSPDNGARRRATLARARAILGERGYATAWATGLGTPLDLIVDQAVDCVSERRSGPGPRTPPVDPDWLVASR